MKFNNLINSTIFILITFLLSFILFSSSANYINSINISSQKSQVLKSKIKTRDECTDALNFIDTIKSADRILSNMFDKFEKKREEYQVSITKSQIEGNDAMVAKLKEKIKYWVDFYTDRLTEVRKYVAGVITEAQNELSDDCKKRITAESNSILEHIEHVALEIKSGNVW